MSDIEHSPSINYRELDAEFLTQQARIWLEAVLNQRFDPKANLADILADGEILDKVSSKIQNLLRGQKDSEPASPKSLSHEHSGKYLPYSNVDSFLKVCQKLGLTGVDLFSSPDVVEKKDIRRVCLCIRTLSKKARARQLRVPNFDYVTHTVQMPTDLVGGLRDSLKHSSNSPSAPKGLENKETERQAQVRSSPLRFGSTGDAGASVESSGFESSDSVSEETAKEPGSASSVTDHGNNRTQDSDKNTDFLMGSRSSSLFDDDATPSEDSRPETHHNVGHKDRSYETSSNQKNPEKSLGQKNVKQNAESNQSVSLSAAEGPADCGKAKKRRAWLPFVSAVVALIGVILVIRTREPQFYEIKKGDTLSQISKRVGKSSWEELVQLNPGIKNPDLIYPSERLRLQSDG